MNKKYQYGDAPVEQKYMEQMKAIIMTVDDFVNGPVRPREVAIVLMMFPFGDGPNDRVNYMSNGVNRKDMIALMKEQIARFEGQPDIKGSA